MRESLGRSVHAIGGCLRRGFVDLQSDGLLLLSLGAARLRCNHRAKGVHRGTASGRMGCLRPDGVCFSGPLGLLLSVLVLGTLVWMLRDYGILNPDRPSLLSTLFVIGIILGIGLSWFCCARESPARSKWIENLAPSF